MANKINNKDKLLKAISTLEHSWGHDTPAEAYWAFDELVDWINSEFNLNLSKPKDEEHGFTLTVQEIENL